MWRSAEARGKVADSLRRHLRFSKSLLCQLGLKHVQPGGKVVRRESHRRVELGEGTGQISLPCVAFAKVNVGGGRTRLRSDGMLKVLNGASDLILFAANDAHQHMSAEILRRCNQVRFEPLLRPGKPVFSNRLLNAGVVESGRCCEGEKTKQGCDGKAVDRRISLSEDIRRGDSITERICNASIPPPNSTKCEN